MKTPPHSGEPSPETDQHDSPVVVPCTYCGSDTREDMVHERPSGDGRDSLPLRTFRHGSVNAVVNSSTMTRRPRASRTSSTARRLPLRGKSWCRCFRWRLRLALEARGSKEISHGIRGGVGSDNVSSRWSSEAKLAGNSPRGTIISLTQVAHRVPDYCPAEGPPGRTAP